MTESHESEASDPRSTGSDDVGTVGEEALRLVRALGTTSPWETGSSDAGARDENADRARDEHACPNGWCPVCGVVAFVRENPEAIQQVTDSAGSLMRALRDLVDVAVTRPRDGGDPPTGANQ